MNRVQGNDVEVGQVVGTDSILTLPAAARDKHLYITGSTGAGKSKLLERLIRQDIFHWPKTRCGLLLIDPHGAIYDGLVRWLAHEDIDRPIIPIDLRRDDWVVAYNLLRRRAAKASVVIDSFVEAMSFVWGQSGTNATPQFEQWASNLLRALYDTGRPLSEALHLLNRQNNGLRRALTAGIQDPLTKQDWAFANALSPEKFDLQVGSTLRRVARFVRNDQLRATFGQSEVSLDLGQALEEGHIILVSLARRHGLVSQADARLFGTLLLADLWSAAQERRDKSRKPRPFYVYLDEFQRFVTPTMAENLAESRGFGLGLTLAHQFPNQLRNAGEHGQALFDEVMENGSTKVVFRLSNIENLQPLAQALFMGCLDPDEVKHRLYATKVLGYREEVRESHSYGHTRASGGTRTQGATEGEGVSGQGEADASGNPAASAEEGEMVAWNRFATASGSDTETWSDSESESVTEQQLLMPILGKELSSVQFRSLDEQLFRAMQRLFGQPDRHCAIRVVGERAPVFLRTLDVKERPVSEERQRMYVEAQFRRWPFFLPMTEAIKQLAARHERILTDALGGAGDEEATTARRKLPQP